MSFKKKFNEVKESAFQTLKERPLETLAVISAAAVATAKVVKTISEVQNSNTWKREVKRREQSQKNI